MGHATHPQLKSEIDLSTSNSGAQDVASRYRPWQPHDGPAALSHEVLREVHMVNPGPVGERCVQPIRRFPSARESTALCFRLSNESSGSGKRTDRRSTASATSQRRQHDLMTQPSDVRRLPARCPDRVLSQQKVQGRLRPWRRTACVVDILRTHRRPSDIDTRAIGPLGDSRLTCISAMRPCGKGRHEHSQISRRALSGM